MTERLFIAIFPPEDVIDSLIDDMADLPGVNWQGEDQLHLTLRFLGDVDRRQRDELIDLLTTIDFSPFDIELGGGDAFRQRDRIKSIHRQVQPNEPLLRLARAIDRRCEMAGLGTRDRHFLPHITLARLNASSPDMENYIAGLAGKLGPGFTADRFTLVSSHLGHAGAQYEPLVDFLAT